MQTTGLKMYVKHAAFMEGVELFAAAVGRSERAGMTLGSCFMQLSLEQP